MLLRLYIVLLMSVVVEWPHSSKGENDKSRSSNDRTLISRPTFVRSTCINLDESWQFAVHFWLNTDGVKFSGSAQSLLSVESMISSGRHFSATEKQRQWYHRVFIIPEHWIEQRILLHIDAADWETKVWLNGKELGMHQGGYDRFSFDITGALKPEGEQELVISVYDPTDSGFQPRGKQALYPDKAFLSATSGIWQSVWLESVPATSIESLRCIPDIDTGVLQLTVSARGETNGFEVRAIALEGDREVSRIAGGFSSQLKLPVPNAKLWSPGNPFLYDLRLEVLKEGKVLDSAMSYFGMRKISIARDEKGIPRLMLNNQRLFQLGVLDQGYWPDGNYMAPSDEALRWDVETIKRLGFNMVRKHVKVEPERWYYWCDKLGLLVWQDMPNGDRPASAKEKEIKRKPESARLFEQDLKRMIEGRGNHPSIVVWVPFNQGWGQYDTARITEMVRQMDPSRLIISASGWHDMGTGDIRSYHQYQDINIPRPKDGRAAVLGECGGLGLAVEGHAWAHRGFWNTTYYSSPANLLEGYRGLIGILQNQSTNNGLAAAVITQFSDVETELNGFVTYDRKVIKMPVDEVRRLNEATIRVGSKPGRN